MPVDSADATVLLRAYLTDLVDRWYGRAMPSEVVDQALADHPSDDLTVFLVAHRDGRPVGCAGLLVTAPGIGEVKRVYVVPGARRLGVGSALLGALEEQALARGLTHLRLDTRDDLVEAHALYLHNGYEEIPAFNSGAYVERWFGKRIA